MSFMVQGLTLNLLLFFFALLLLGGNWSLAFGIAVKLSIIKLMYLLSLHAFPPCFTTPFYVNVNTNRIGGAYEVWTQADGLLQMHAGIFITPLTYLFDTLFLGIKIWIPFPESDVAAVLCSFYSQLSLTSLQPLKQTSRTRSRSTPAPMF